VAEHIRHPPSKRTDAGGIAVRDSEPSCLGHLNCKAWKAHPAGSAIIAR